MKPVTLTGRDPHTSKDEISINIRIHTAHSLDECTELMLACVAVQDSSVEAERLISTPDSNHSLTLQELQTFPFLLHFLFKPPVTTGNIGL